MNRIRRLLYRGLFVLHLRSRLGFCGKGAVVFHPLKVEGAQNIHLSDRVTISHGAWLYAKRTIDGRPRLTIGPQTTIGHFSHIVVAAHLAIGKDVLIADKVFISDCGHIHRDVTRPISQQGVEFIGEVKIGDGTWIGEGVSIIGASVGMNCVIGANSVVTRSIPDFCVAVGSPARIIKTYDHSNGAWRNVGTV